MGAKLCRSKKKRATKVEEKPIPEASVVSEPVKEKKKEKVPVPATIEKYRDEVKHNPAVLEFDYDKEGFASRLGVLADTVAKSKAEEYITYMMPALANAASKGWDNVYFWDKDDSPRVNKRYGIYSPNTRQWVIFIFRETMGFKFAKFTKVDLENVEEGEEDHFFSLKVHFPVKLAGKFTSHCIG